MKLSPVSKRRIATLIRFMRSLPKSANKHFNMGGWVYGAPLENRSLTAQDLHKCGTAACAAGWAATIQSFKKQGFTYNPACGFSVTPEVFFGVSETLAQAMFYSSVNTPAAWARNAERAVKKHEARHATA